MGGRRTVAHEDEQRAKWLARLSRFEKHAGTVAAFCAAEGVSTWSFYTWRRRLAAAAGTEQPTQAVVRAAAPAAGASGFIDAGVARMAAAGRRVGMPEAVSAAGVELQIDLGGGVLLRVVRR